VPADWPDPAFPPAADAASTSRRIELIGASLRSLDETMTPTE
jgi:hypothetical protein